MKYSKFIALGLLALTCAGCSTAKTSTAPTAKSSASSTIVKSATPPSQKTTVITPEQTMPSDADAQTANPAASNVPTTTFTVDDTWQTYVNAAVKFEFKWPTKGTYAPEWSVSFGKEGDGLIKDGCAIDENNQSKTMVNEFCHTTSLVETGDRLRTDYYATKKGNQFVLVKLTKRLYAMSDKCKQTGITTSANSCKEFKTDDFAALLDTISGTFKFNE